MSVKNKMYLTDAVYFCTFTCYKHLHLFRILKYYTFIYNWFDLLNSKGIKILAYVIMPNHLHIILYLPKNSTNIDKIIGNGKRFMSYDIVKMLKKKNALKILKILEDGITNSEKKKGTKHKVFEKNFDAKIIENEKFFTQKLNYIHLNPVSKKWNLTDDFIDYPHSSAGFYGKKDSKGYPVTDYRDLYQ